MFFKIVQILRIKADLHVSKILIFLWPPRDILNVIYSMVHVFAVGRKKVLQLDGERRFNKTS